MGKQTSVYVGEGILAQIKDVPHYTQEEIEKATEEEEYIMKLIERDNDY